MSGHLTFESVLGHSASREDLRHFFGGFADFLRGGGAWSQLPIK